MSGLLWIHEIGLMIICGDPLATGVKCRRDLPHNDWTKSSFFFFNRGSVVKSRVSRALLAACIIGVGAGLSGCDGDDEKGGGGGGATTLGGTAATGQAMASATIDIRCGAGVLRTVTANASGAWSASVPTASLPCVIRASDGVVTHYSFTVGSGSTLVTNVSPLSTLALARLLRASPASVFASLTDADLASLGSVDVAAAIAALNAALSGYALPAGFNPVTSPLIAATSGQEGNHYDDLLEQFSAALGSTTLDSVIASAASGTYPVLPVPSYAQGVGALQDFFTKFSGDYTLSVSAVGSEGASAAGATLFPRASARTVRIADNGDVTLFAVGRTVSYDAADYVVDFSGSTSTQNRVNYRDGVRYPLAITYDPATGTLGVTATGFLAGDEGYVALQGVVFVPAADTPEPPPLTCSSGDDKLVFTGGPADFCGFTRSSSANSIEHYFQFTSVADSHGQTYVKFNLNTDDSAVVSMVIENDDYSYGCGGALPACTGVTLSSGTTYRQFALVNTTFTPIAGTTTSMTVSGTLVHPVTPPDDGDGDGLTLAQRLSAPFAGTYVLSCYSNGSGSALAERTVVINADGTSTLDGNPVIAQDHGGMIRYQRGTSDSEYYEYDAEYFDASLKETSFKLRFTADGALVTDFNRSHDAFVGGVGGTCTGISGPSVGSNPVTRADLPGLIGGYALTDTLTCSGANAPLPVGLSTVAIDSDGTLRAGTFSLTPAQYTAGGSSFNIRDAVSFPSTSILQPAVIGLTVAGNVPTGAGGTALGSFFFRFDRDLNATYVQASLNPGTATCTPSSPKTAAAL